MQAVFVYVLYLHKSNIQEARDLDLLHLVGKAEDIKCFVSILHVLLVVDPVNGELALGHVPIVRDRVCQKTFLLSR